MAEEVADLGHVGTVFERKVAKLCRSACARAPAGPHVEERFALDAKAVSLQFGVVDAAAGERAPDAWLLVVVIERCRVIE